MKSVTELGEALKAVLGKKETLVEDKLSLLNSNWIAVTSRAEEWLNLLLVRKKAEAFPLLFVNMETKQNKNKKIRIQE